MRRINHSLGTSPTKKLADGAEELHSVLLCSADAWWFKGERASAF